MTIIKTYYEYGLWHYLIDFDGTHGKTFKFKEKKTDEEVLKIAEQEFKNFELIKNTIDGEL
jgi:hypothetical protein